MVFRTQQDVLKVLIHNLVKDHWHNHKELNLERLTKEGDRKACELFHKASDERTLASMRLLVQYQLDCFQKPDDTPFTEDITEALNAYWQERYIGKERETLRQDVETFLRSRPHYQSADALYQSADGLWKDLQVSVPYLRDWPYNEVPVKYICTIRESTLLLRTHLLRVKKDELEIAYLRGEIEDHWEYLLTYLDWPTVPKPLTAAQSRWKASFQSVLEECKLLHYRFLSPPLSMSMADYKFRVHTYACNLIPENDILKYAVNWDDRQTFWTIFQAYCVGSERGDWAKLFALPSLTPTMERMKPLVLEVFERFQGSSKEKLMQLLEQSLVYDFESDGVLDLRSASAFWRLRKAWLSCNEDEENVMWTYVFHDLRKDPYPQDIGAYRTTRYKR
jgi:hypothetical protein